MTLTQVRKAPHVPQTDTEAHTGQNVLGLVVPLGPPLRILFLHPLQVVVVGDPELQARVRDHQPHGEAACKNRCTDWVCMCGVQASCYLHCSLWRSPHKFMVFYCFAPWIDKQRAKLCIYFWAFSGFSCNGGQELSLELKIKSWITHKPLNNKTHVGSKKSLILISQKVIIDQIFK